jgi:hypothetical protein
VEAVDFPAMLDTDKSDLDHTVPVREEPGGLGIDANDRFLKHQRILSHYVISS